MITNINTQEEQKSSEKRVMVYPSKSEINNGKQETSRRNNQRYYEPIFQGSLLKKNDYQLHFSALLVLMVAKQLITSQSILV